MSDLTTDELNAFSGKTWIVAGSKHLSDGTYRYIKYTSLTHSHTLKRIEEREDAGEGPEIAPRLVMGIATLSHSQMEKLAGESAEYQLTTGPARLDTVASQERRSQKKKDEKKRANRGQEVHERRYRLMMKMADNVTLDLLLDQHFRRQKIKQLAQEEGISEDTVERDFVRLLDFGLDVSRAAHSDYGRCGHRPGIKYANKQGRKRNLAKGEHPEWKGINSQDWVTKILLFVCSGFKPKKTLAANFRTFRTIYGVSQKQMLEGGRVATKMLPEEEFITEREFRYRVEQIRGQLARVLDSKQLEKISAVEVKTAIGSSRDGVYAPGQRLIIDSTVADVYLVCHWNRCKIIGRPVVYVVIDAATSLIVAVHVTLHAPSATQGKIALFKALTSKKALLSSCGLEEYEFLMPAAPRPGEVMWDRGELLSEDGRDVGKDLGAIISIPGPYVPEWKAIVERYFKTINQLSIHWMPGTTLGRLRERGEPDHRLDAVLTIGEFTKIILIGALLWNLRGRPSTMLEPEQLAERCDPGPISLYNWGLVNRHGSPFYFPVDEAAVRLLPAAVGQIGERGIEKDSLVWAGDWMESHETAIQASQGAKAAVYRLPDEPDKALVHFGNDQHLREARLSSIFPEHEDWATEDVDEYVAIEKQAGDLHALQTQKFETAAHNSIGQTLDKAKTLTRHAREENPQTKAERTNSIRANREETKKRDELASGTAARPSTQEKIDATEFSVPGGTDFLAALSRIAE